MDIGYIGMFPQNNQHLQKGAALAAYIPDKSVIVIDGMSLVKSVGQNDGTFGEIAAVFHSMVFKEGSHSSRIDIVFDTYRDMSIENVERTLRGNDQGLQLQNISETKLAKQWKRFLRQSCNNASLIQYLLNVWKKYKYNDKLVGKCLYITILDKCWKITHGCCEEFPATSIHHLECSGTSLQICM